jgi:hypothetical protein
MSSITKIQFRGHCQCCCRLQAVTTGSMSKHGYEVKNRGDYGWFQGVCSGHRYAPVEQDRKVLDQTVVDIRGQTAEMRALADRYEAGKSHPRLIETNRYDAKTHTYITKPWAEGNEYEQTRALQSAVSSLRHRARSGDSLAQTMLEIADKYHGQSLQKVVKGEGPAPIQNGDKKKSARGVLTAEAVYRGKVSWSGISETDGRVIRSSMSTRSWRTLPDAE